MRNQFIRGWVIRGWVIRGWVIRGWVIRGWIAMACLIFSVYALVPAQAPAQDQPEESGRHVTLRVPPVYPELARRMNLDGIVKVRVTVAPDGTAKATEVLGGNPLLAKAAQDAIARWKWAPAPRESTELVTLRFHPH